MPHIESQTIRAAQAPSLTNSKDSKTCGTDTKERAAIAPPRPVADSGGGTILVVEDNTLLRTSLVRQMARLGYAVLEAPNAAAGLDVLRETPVRLVLTDVLMPGGMDGVELARQIRLRWPMAKVILMSGFADERMSG